MTTTRTYSGRERSLPRPSTSTRTSCWTTSPFPTVSLSHCFPSLSLSLVLRETTSLFHYARSVYPTGRFGPNEKRERQVNRGDFVQSRLELDDRRFARDPQWILHQSHVTDMKAADRGVYCCVNTRVAKRGITAGRFLLSCSCFEKVTCVHCRQTSHCRRVSQRRGRQESGGESQDHDVQGQGQRRVLVQPLPHPPGVGPVLGVSFPSSLSLHNLSSVGRLRNARPAC